MLPVGGQVTYATGGYAFDMTAKSVSPVIAPPTTDAIVSSIAVARDGTFLAYCLSSGGNSDIVVVDLRTKPATSFTATTDGKSCFPSF
jgi:Tol biopolymer transport system component